VTPLETLALLAVIAVLLVGVARTTLRKRERRRTPRGLDPDLTPLQLYRAGVSRPPGVQGVRRDGPSRPAEPIMRPDNGSAAARTSVQTVETGAVPERFAPPAQTAEPVSRPIPEASSSTTRKPAPVALPDVERPESAPTGQSARTAPKAATPVPQGTTRPARSAVGPDTQTPRRVETQPRPDASPPRRVQQKPPAGRKAATPAPTVESGTATPRDPASGPAADGTLQLLPGRLEVLSGLGHREEIRFVKVGNTEPAVTFGRSVGEPHLHVRLESPTVSRMHARMRRTGAGWVLSNLSSTNPVVVNGQPMTNGTEHQLQDGDRIEMGEVVFQFRAG
jgi:hypothetical protein